jgi:hypothetical protein
MGRTRSAPGLLAVVALACSGASPEPKTPRPATGANPVAAPANAAEPFAFAERTSSPQDLDSAGAIVPWPSECRRSDAALARVAGRLARNRLRGATAIDTAELSFALRAEGSPYVRPSAWTLEADELTSEIVEARLHGWLGTAGGGGERRCGFSLLRAPSRSVLAAVAVDALADLDPLPTSARTGSWLDIDARLLAFATDAKVIVLGPSGAPFGLPTSFDGERAQARLHADRPGAYLIQLLGSVAGGPRPLLEASVYVDVRRPSSFFADPAPGESAALSTSGSDPGFALLEMVNGARASEGRTALSRSAVLDALAQQHAQAMQRSERLAHDVGDGDPDARLASTGMQVVAAGENVARAPDLVRAHRVLWASPSHRQNLLEPRFDAVGMGVAQDPDGSLWVCELFADLPEQPAASR